MQNGAQGVYVAALIIGFGNAVVVERLPVLTGIQYFQPAHDVRKAR